LETSPGTACQEKPKLENFDALVLSDLLGRKVELFERNKKVSREWHLHCYATVLYVSTASQWNNNNAEHAIKAYSALRKVMVGTSTRAGIEEYIILLSICETCKYQGLDFLDFLRSGEKNIAVFRTLKHRKLSSSSPVSFDIPG
jgi:hypothetical protein